MTPAEFNTLLAARQGMTPEAWAAKNRKANVEGLRHIAAAARKVGNDAFARAHERAADSLSA
jgi:hypothetical protein